MKSSNPLLAASSRKQPCLECGELFSNKWLSQMRARRLHLLVSRHPSTIKQWVRFGLCSNYRVASRYAERMERTLDGLSIRKVGTLRVFRKGAPSHVYCNDWNQADGRDLSSEVKLTDEMGNAIWFPSIRNFCEPLEGIVASCYVVPWNSQREFYLIAADDEVRNVLSKIRKLDKFENEFLFLGLPPIFWITTNKGSRYLVKDGRVRTVDVIKPEWNADRNARLLCRRCEDFQFLQHNTARIHLFQTKLRWTST